MYFSISSSLKKTLSKFENACCNSVFLMLLRKSVHSFRNVVVYRLLGGASPPWVGLNVKSGDWILIARIRCSSLMLSHFNPTARTNSFAFFSRSSGVMIGWLRGVTGRYFSETVESDGAIVSDSTKDGRDPPDKPDKLAGKMSSSQWAS